MNVARFLVDTARAFGDRPALTWRGEGRSYADLNRRVAALAEGMRAFGLGPGSRVAILMDNRPELLEVLFATFRFGGTVVPCNGRSTAGEVAHIVEDAGVELLITDPAHADVAEAGKEGAKVLEVGPGYEALLVDGVDPWSIVDVDAQHVAWLFYTSGTTGRPKGAMLTHAVLNFVTVAWLADLMPITEHDVTLHAAPLTHGAGFHALAATARGAHQLIPDGASFDPGGLLDLIRDAGVTNTWLVPTQIIRLTEAAAGAAPVPTLQHVVYGGAPIAPVAMARALEVFGPIFVQLYGQGETPMTATVLRREDHRPELLGTAGRPRLGIDLRLIDEDGAEVPVGAVGEVVVRGPSVMAGYWRRPEATADAIRDGWLRTGDLGRLSENGVLQLLDRTKDMIISGGANVYAVEVEAVLAMAPEVADVAVIGVPDDLWGERVEAVVVLAPGITLDEASLDARCRSSLADYKVPRRYHAFDDLPRNAYGKVLKTELRARLQPA